MSTPDEMFIPTARASRYLGISYTATHDLLIPLEGNPKRVKGRLRFVKMVRNDTKRQRVLILKSDLLALAVIPDDAEQLDVHEMEAA